MMENAERDNIDTAICPVIKGRTILYLAKSLARGGMRASNSTRSKTLEIECALALDLSEMVLKMHVARRYLARFRVPEYLILLNYVNQKRVL
ncbi:unnamed protein product [Arctia plantaginis]|uniref:Uncharacterized protein n=1 Tax=Arctia plantaginis TaxID=874455 RepID=A0A8S0ZZA2_ARCPL|nr:unnamed protein product [Arctia plantaginis]